jgi:uncharacterized membrane protein YccC
MGSVDTMTERIQSQAGVLRIQPVLVNSARMAVAAVASVLAARILRLPEAFWATLTTLVIAQTSLGAALTVSWRVFVGTALGAVVGAIAASLFGPHVVIFGTCVFILGLLCAVARSDLITFRFGGVTLPIVLLVPRAGALHGKSPFIGSPRCPSELGWR